MKSNMNIDKIDNLEISQSIDLIALSVTSTFFLFLGFIGINSNLFCLFNVSGVFHQ